jgi:hypothetical protein
MFKNAVPASHTEKHRFCITEANPLIRFRHIIRDLRIVRNRYTGCCETAAFFILKQTVYILNTGFCISVMKFSYLKGRRISSLINCYLSKCRTSMFSLHFKLLFPKSRCSFKFVGLWRWFMRYRSDPLAFDFIQCPNFSVVESSWNVMAHGDAREGKWRENWRVDWVASTLPTTSERVVSNITTADAHTSASSSRLNWSPCRFKWIRPFRRMTKSGVCACAITFQTQSTTFR